jgi:hypothetical protein
MLAVETGTSALNESALRDDGPLKAYVQELMGTHERPIFWRCEKCELYWRTDPKGRTLRSYPDTAF